MSPSICDGDEVLVQSCSMIEVEKGEVVLFLDQGSKELTFHRLIDFPFVTKGDNTFFHEENSPDSFLGKLVVIKRDNCFYKLPKGRIINYLSKMSLNSNKILARIFKNLLKFQLYFCRSFYKLPKSKNISEHLLNHL